MGLGTLLELELGSQLSSEHLEIVRDLVEDLEAVPVDGVETEAAEWLLIIAT